jgi:seryl-tRNA synthetase
MTTPKKRARTKHAASAVKHQTKRAANKTATKSVHKKATTATVRATATKLAKKLKHVQHDAADVAMRIGSTMETIGGAVMSLVKPSGGSKNT